MKNKKGDVSDTLYWILNIGLVAIIMFSIVLGINLTTKAYADTHDLEFYLLNERIFNSLLYIEPTSQSIQNNVIDLEQFNEGTIARSISLEGSYQEIGVKATLQYDNNTKEIYLNQENYEDFIIFRTFTLKKDIMVKDGNEYYKGIVEIEQAMRKSMID